MIDTVRIRTPYISQTDAEKVKHYMKMFQVVDMETGLNLKQSFNGRFPIDTHHYSVYVLLKEEIFVSKWLPSQWKKVPQLEDSEPYLIIECSLAKFMQGHNIFGGSDKLSNIQLILDFLTNYYDIPTINYSDCYIDRIDISYSYKLNDCVDYLRTLNQTYYSRRKMRYYEDECVYFAGSITTLKYYNKHAEFKKHDYKKLQDEFLLKRSENVLRIEVEIKKRKLESLFGTLKAGDINMGKLIKVFNDENAKIYNKIDLTKPIVKHEQVHDLLIRTYGIDLGKKLYYSYTRILEFGIKKGLGEDVMSRATKYRHLSYLRECNINVNENATFVLSDANKKEFYSFYPSSVSERII